MCRNGSMAVQSAHRRRQRWHADMWTNAHGQTFAVTCRRDVLARSARWLKMVSPKRLANESVARAGDVAQHACLGSTATKSPLCDMANAHVHGCLGGLCGGCSGCDGCVSAMGAGQRTLVGCNEHAAVALVAARVTHVLVRAKPASTIAEPEQQSTVACLQWQGKFDGASCRQGKACFNCCRESRECQHARTASRA